MEWSSESAAVRRHRGTAERREGQAAASHPQREASAQEDARGGGRMRGRTESGGESRGAKTALSEARTALALALYLLALRALVQLSLQRLVLSRTSGLQGEFDARQARVYLEHITAIGPRTTGSAENEILTVQYLLEQITLIEEQSNSLHRISVDVQRPTGSFSIDFLGGFTSYYDNITNVVVKLEPQDGAKYAVLANCHFDSVANSPGASDDAVSCAVMLEVLRVMAASPEPLQHAVVFLFNGAEENVLQASHGFITQHPWASLIRAFINLEAAGVGGKELVFQTGPENPWLVQAYVSAAKHPFASVVAQEVFQSGIIPSDTDFRIYRDFGNIPGIDLAFIENGYIYHTKYDTADRILIDSIQRAGDNILAVLKYLATSDMLASSSEYRHGSMVFFDVLGLLVIAYPSRVGSIINYMVVMAVVLYLGRKLLRPKHRNSNYVRDFLCGLGITFISWFTSLVTVLIIAVFVSLIGQSLSWYNYFYIAVCLYGTATVAKIILIHTLAKRFYYVNASDLYLGELFFDTSLFVHCGFLVALTAQGFCSAFMSAVWVAFPLLTKLCVYKDFKKHGAKGRFIALYLLGMFIPYLYGLYLIWAVFEMFTPILGRSGSEIPPDVVLASILAVCVMILSSYFITFIYLVNSTKKTILTLILVCAVTFLLVCSGAFFPYSSNPDSPKPKRVFLQHVSRTFHNLEGSVVKRDSGIWINGFDYTGMSHVTPHIPEINDTIRAHCEENAPLCGFPWYLPVHFLIRKNWYLPAPEISPRNPAHFRLVSKEKMPWDSIKLTFEATGPSHMSFYVRTHKGSTLSQWSLGNGIPVTSRGGDYFVFYSHGLQASAWQFWIEVQQVSEEQPEGMVTVAIAAHYLSGENKRSSQLDALKEKFPDWSFPSAWVSTYSLFVF
ncbi:endoplasmic reticulum metallopeptidase 1 isoform X1 [Rattus norvegicus]|uniref:endoplasmic reticulum metallopeptidase 1 isoform X1 n=1 Tax=Rattus norvegicus TaxID=10116 RepID=UPI0003D0A04B|nr:endoplasmic reticulum metallopeptidase 1 isoform X1 [Rattus norvegicus]|eukprot:XP_006231303.1 PREDICTED: endoplasmic reticulum metallopeptidase 1 isoform X1 [Rattus norvegicus]